MKAAKKKPPAAKSKTKPVSQSPGLRALSEEVRSLKRKLWVAERMRFEAVTKGGAPARREMWDGKLLAAGVAHEFNNILGAADGHAEWALDSGAPEDMREALEVVRKACSRSLQITKSLQGLPSLREESAGVFALSKVARDLTQHFRPLAAKSGILLKVDLPEVDLYGQDSQLYEVLVNLIKNAFEALQSAGTDSPQVMCSGRLVGKTQIKIIVSDNGPGISPAFRERVFHPFFTTKGRLKEMLEEGEERPVSPALAASQGGSGLGLFLSRSIIQTLGGRLEHLASTSGTRFQISLPLASKRRRKI
jgi:two-component system, LuxR family, sensor kinase FixL